MGFKSASSFEVTGQWETLATVGQTIKRLQVADGGDVEFKLGTLAVAEASAAEDRFHFYEKDLHLNIVPEDDLQVRSDRVTFIVLDIL